jgi:putative ABC transport system permease protein
VLLQFLTEAVVLSALGGLAGLVVAQLVVLALVPLLKLEWLFVPQINVIAFAISALIGVVFGYFPARRAAALNPIDALRHE